MDARPRQRRLSWRLVDGGERRPRRRVAIAAANRSRAHGAELGLRARRLDRRTTMKRIHAATATLVLALAAGCGGQLGTDGEDVTAAIGNGAPSGPHFDLNLIGVSNVLTQGNAGGSVIHVPLDGSCQIGLAEGDFQVLDSNCTDGGAQFQLPNPDPTNSGTTTYSVYVRALGKPGGSSSQTTCATDTTGTLYCSIYSSVQTRTKGKQTFTNVSKELLYIYYYNSKGQLVRAPLFDSSLQNFYWQYDNKGLKNLQMRFYQVSTTVP
jgi:hypothetical protein